MNIFDHALQFTPDLEYSHFILETCSTLARTVLTYLDTANTKFCTRSVFVHRVVGQMHSTLIQTFAPQLSQQGRQYSTEVCVCEETNTVDFWGIKFWFKLHFHCVYLCLLFSCKCSISCQFSKTFLQQPASSIFQLWTLRGAAILLGGQPYQALLVDVDLGESLKEMVACALLFLGVVFFSVYQKKSAGIFKKNLQVHGFLKCSLSTHDFSWLSCEL